MVAGPLSTMMLADQGAEVIKVEPPRGDVMRNLGPGRNGTSASFLCCNRNKRSLVLDLKTTHAAEIVCKLISTADVLVHNFRSEAADRVGLGENTVRAIKRNLVYVSISGFGESGPYAGQRAYDPIIQALSGLAEIQRDPDTRRPRMVRTIIADYTTALTAAQAMAAALFARERSGEGQHVRLAMLDAMISYLWPEAMASLTFVGEERDPADAELGPDLVFATRDRYLTAAAISDTEWAGMCRALGREDLISDPRFRTTRDRSINASERRALTAAELEKWEATAILARLLENDVPSAPVLSRFELLNEEQVRANAILQQLVSADFGRLRMPRPAARFDRTPAQIRTAAPVLGADSARILEELGYGPETIAQFERSGTIVNRRPEHGSSESRA